MCTFIVQLTKHGFHDPTYSYLDKYRTDGKYSSNCENRNTTQTSTDEPANIISSISNQYTESHKY